MRTLYVLAILVAATAREVSAQSERPHDLFLSDWMPPPGQRCEIDDKAPAPDALLDTAALLARLRGGGTRGSLVLAWIRPDTVGWRPEYGPMFDSLTVLERTLSDTAARQVHDAVLATLKQSGASVAGALLRLDFSGQPVLRTAYSLVCRPAVIEDVSMSNYRARLRAAAGQTPRRAVIGFIVGRDGATHAPRMITSSGDGEFDAAALAASAALHYRPALFNRVPVAVYVRLPVSVN